jgi:hypothetical protein
MGPGSVPSENAVEAHECRNCARPKPEPVAPLILMGLGGMLLFFAFGFGIPGALGVEGFLWLALVLAVVGGAMLISGWALYARHRREVAKNDEEEMAKAKCEYCGSQNQIGEQKCCSCGAPLR